MEQAQITREHLQSLAAEAVPLAGQLGIAVDSVQPGQVVARVPYRADYVRPGQTIAGPVMMALADFVMWGVVLSLVGPSHMAVTSNMTINFLRRPAPGDLLARGNILKLGRRLATGEVLLFSEQDELVAHVTCTYSLPPESE